MRLQQSTRWFWAVFSIFLLGYIYVYSQLLVLYLVNVSIGITASVLFPLFLRVLFPAAMKWIMSQWRDSDVPGYTNVKGYIRVWTLKLEWGMFIPSVLLLSGLVPDSWMKSLLWMVLGVLSLFVYPRYVKPVLRKSISDDTQYSLSESRFVWTSSIFGGAATVIGAAGILLSGIGQLIS